MRLINTGTLDLHEFISEVPSYAILSHRWRSGTDGEATLQQFRKFQRIKAAGSYGELSSLDVSGVECSNCGSRDITHSTSRVGASVDENKRNGASEVPPGIQKVLGFCQKAKESGYEWAWIDTVCIDKTNNAELSEAINSMYKWYAYSDICFVQLHDVDGIEDAAAFARSEWFTRGWTLQELLAPREVIFCRSDWEGFGTRETLKNNISAITGIPAEALSKPRYILRCSAAQRMSWAANRTTTREEDIAYCLLGLFNVNMELMYGEGAEKAFRRLQIKILEEYDDESLLTWDLDEECPIKGKLCIFDPEDQVNQLVDICSLTGVLATRPKQFSRTGQIELSDQYAPESPSQISKWGLGLTREVSPLKHVSMRPRGSDDIANSAARVVLLPLACQPAGSTSSSHIIIAEDLFSLPTKRWCRVILSQRWMNEGMAVLKKEELDEDVPKRLDVRISWPDIPGRSRSIAASGSFNGAPRKGGSLGGGSRRRGTESLNPSAWLPRSPRDR